MLHIYRHAIGLTYIALAVVFSTPPVLGADLGGKDTGPSPAIGEWTFVFTTYGWIPWLSGNMAIKGRSFDVQADPSAILGHLDWSTVPAWMSYAEARNGPIGLFNDVVYANISGSKDFARELPGNLPALAGGVSINFEEVIVEFGGAYQVWSGTNPVTAHSAAIDLVAGGRYWHQDVEASAVLARFNVDRSGSVDWVDPFVGARLRQDLGQGDSLVIRADAGGFGAGSEASWEVLATYNWQLPVMCGFLLDGYVGYRALSVDYSQGSGNTEYKYDVLMQGPVIGTTLHF
ncbi:hypothetical protein [Hyphomicrobium sp. 99]|uniref:hypothetical protein n=1 Tax=Hyphomicrobium sp. 99 TaxID=1163419 RepID=UPI0006977DD5|nr:hypothetical protein [Hyphomicrobium sp. 99]